MKPLVAILSLVCLGLAAQLLLRHNNGQQAEEELTAVDSQLQDLSHHVAETHSKLQFDKAELLRQFNDLAALRAQVALLKEETAINQRLSWMAQGVYLSAGRKGAEALVARTGPSALAANPALSVELQQQGAAPP